MKNIKHLLILLSISSITVHLEAVTVNPSLCPTNKIAPHRRIASWDQSRPRTLGLIYELLGPRRPSQIDPLNDLQEQPQEDDPDDCGEIDDYDESDLSSVTAGAQKRKDRVDRYFFHQNYNYGRPSYYSGPNRPPSTAHRPQPQRSTRPPYGSSGIFVSNVYRPPQQQNPSDHIKPVTEHIQDNPQQAYQPGLIGGNLGHIVGYPPIRPTTAASSQIAQNFRFPESGPYTNRRQKKSQETNKYTSILGSFVDLIFN